MGDYKMSTIVSVGEAVPSNMLMQEEVEAFSRTLFSKSYKDIDRLLKAFENSQIEKRHFVKNIEWYQEEHSFAEKNGVYIQSAMELGSAAIIDCLNNHHYLKRKIDCEEIDAIFFVSSTGIATPTIEARIMNKLPFTEYTKRIPIWGLGCAGGAVGLSRAHEYCEAYPNAKVIVLSIELCSLTFQRNDHSKSNLIGTSLFGDGVACVLMTGKEVELTSISTSSSLPSVVATQTTTMRNSLDVMGWDVKDEGLFVIFSKDIPTIVEKWLKPNVHHFLHKYNVTMQQIKHFIAHPGGKKVLDAYAASLQPESDSLEIAMQVLHQYGNMSSPTVLFVLNRFLQKGRESEWGLCTALGPGFSSELLLLRWGSI